MIPASYLFKDLYRSHWEVDASLHAPKAEETPSIPPIMPHGGAMRAAWRAMTRIVHMPVRTSHAGGFGL